MKCLFSIWTSFAIAMSPIFGSYHFTKSNVKDEKKTGVGTKIKNEEYSDKSQNNDQTVDFKGDDAHFMELNDD